MNEKNMDTDSTDAKKILNKSQQNSPAVDGATDHTQAQNIQMTSSIISWDYFADITQCFINFRSLKEILKETATVTPEIGRALQRL